MSLTDIPLPKHYENTAQGLGRVVDGIFDVQNTTSRGTGNLYEVDYNKMRDALEDLRDESPSLLTSAAAHMTGRSEMDEAGQKRANLILNQHGYGLESDLLKKVVKDWKSSSPSMSSSYSPPFMLDIGTPVSRKFFEAVAQKVENIRENAPQFGQALDEMLKGGGSKAPIYAERWYKEKHGDDSRSMSRSFANSVSAITGLNAPAGRAYVQAVPFDETKYTQSADL